MKKLIAVAMFLSVAATSNPALGAGIELQEQGATAHARGLAVRAFLDEASTLFFNPAGLAWLTGFEIQVGDTIALPVFSYADPNGVNADADTMMTPVTPPHAYITYGMPLGDGSLGFGAGVNFPFGMALEWGTDFAGRYVAWKSELQIPEILLGAGYAPVRQVSIGAALVVCPAHVYMARYMGREFGLVGDDGSPIEDAYVEMAGEGQGIGFHAGIQARPVEGLYLGLVYRHPIKLELEGDAHFELPGLTDRSAFPDQKVQTEFNLPRIIAFGVGYQVLEQLYAELDVDYTFWSVFKDIPMTFPDDKTGQLTQTLAQEWVDGFTIRLGAEYDVDETLTLRLGGGYDQNPAVDENLGPMLPDSDRVFLGGGVGYRFDFGAKVDASYGYALFLKRTVTGHACTEADTDSACNDSNDNFVAYDEDGNATWVGNRFPATYDNAAHLLIVTLGYQF